MKKLAKRSLQGELEEEEVEEEEAKTEEQPSEEYDGAVSKTVNKPTKKKKQIRTLRAKITALKSKQINKMFDSSKSTSYCVSSTKNGMKVWQQVFFSDSGSQLDVVSQHKINKDGIKQI